MNLKSFIPAPLIPPLRACRNYLRGGRYRDRYQSELAHFSDAEQVHGLPPIAKYWADRHLHSILQPFGFTNSIELFRGYIGRVCGERAGEVVQCLSVGAGDSATEINIARWLLENNIQNFAFECIDINAEQLNRGSIAARENGVSEHFSFSTFDVNAWRPRRQFMFVLAVQSLHHVQKLEILFDRIKEALHADGYFMSDDMIGRNGHQRWPEALRLVEELWAELPEKYKYNHQLKKVDKNFVNWDCSTEGFEGIRSQDVLPLLIKNFSFDVFVAFGNIIDPFIDRGFGPNFDPGNEWDRNFIDRVHALDVIELEAGRIKPTHMMVVMRKKPVDRPKIYKHMTPEFCVRRT
jgi:2-polyprenyl-3-methyl-5-hydroxy-6-metoxy-1,4-benzoquinol methylase